MLRFGIAGDLYSKRSINVWESRAVLIATLLPTSLLNIVMHSGATMWIVCGSLRINTLSLRENYTGLPMPSSCSFDTELVSKVVSDLKRGKAADIAGLTSEHLIFSHPLTHDNQFGFTKGLGCNHAI